MDSGVRQVIPGFYTAYAYDLEPQRRALYASAQTLARSQRLGLWQQSQATAPWVYRNGENPASPVCADRSRQGCQRG